MAIESLGMIEVHGFLGAVVAADAALKAANVDLQDLHITRGGLVTVLLTGDVSAVNASVDAGVASIERFNCLISQHVIARMDRQTEELTQPQPPTPTETATTTLEEKPESKLDVKPTPAPNTKVPELKAEQATPNSTPAPKAIGKPKNAPRRITADPATWTTTKSELEKMRVVDLRRQAYRMEIQTLTKKQIKMGNKRTLIQAILDDLQGRDNA
ncbi:MAG TPA: BMC domain-containing protein [Candidatus Levilactobacillus faecigallinarum]|uniref:BMC domain-containing protein n=1 Tax=Candidatus Levilactobacillus faecigallinarum TaxID=2838638 RepID=A0A9D1QSR7_9LACO|nr:BMC domain-containing protein [Candidatus Levilactobacillus faecigallinarum]